MKKTLLAYILFVLLISMPSYAFQNGGTQTDYDISIDDTLFTETPDKATEQEQTNITPPTYKERTFSPDYKSRYKGSDYDYTEKKAPNNAFTRFLAKIRKFLSNLFSTSPSNGESVSVIETIAKTISILLIITVAILIIIYAVRGKFSGLFSRKNTPVIIQDEATENILETDFAALIQKTESQSNYRLATRYYYLWLLKELSNRGFIKWNLDKTNSDYYYEIYDSRIRADFKYLSYLYDYIWYGEFTLDDASYQKARSAFKKTINTL